MKKIITIWNNLSAKSSTIVNSYMERAKLTENLFMIVSALIIGLVVGYGAVGIRWMIDIVSLIGYSGDGSFLDRVIAAPWYIKLIVPTIGGLIVGPTIYFLAPEAKGHGVPEVMQAIISRNGIIKPRIAIIKAFTSAVTIGTGGSVGREGPIIQIGSTIGSTIGQFLKVPTSRMKTFVACGAAAGIAAAFNAPIGGALFALEIILMEFTAAQLSPIIISSVLATVISHAYEGDIPAFHIHGTYEMLANWEFALYFPLGALCGIIAWLFIKVLYSSEDFWDDKIKIIPYLKPALGGLLVGGIAIMFPHIMGVGYKTITATLEGNLSSIVTEGWMQHNLWLFCLVLMLVKIVSTSITLSSGGSGGSLSPSLFIGVMIGAVYGILVNSIFPGQVSHIGMYALVGMCGLLAGTLRAPLTAIIIVFEMTKEISIMLPLMITCTLAMIISTKLSRESIYTLTLIQRNINIKGRADVNILKHIYAQDLMDVNYTIVKENEPFNIVIEKLLNKRHFSLSVHSLNEEFMGLITLDSVKYFIFEKDELKNIMIAGDMADNNVPRVKTTTNCKDVVDFMSRKNIDILPVMSSEKKDIQVGVIRRRDIDIAYSKEIERMDLTYNLAEKIAASKEDKDVQIYEGFGLSEVQIPKEFYGESIRDLQIRNKYGVDIISISSVVSNKSTVNIVPSPDYKFAEHDSIIVAGKIGDINRLKTQS